VADTTTIEWTEVTWNPVTGCDRVSPGCDTCYALTLAKRLKAMGNRRYQRDGDPSTSGPGFGVTIHPDVITAPLTWRRPRMIFVNSMSDLFHQDVPDDVIARVFAVMAATSRHTYQVLTKRHGRMRSLLNQSEFWHLVGKHARHSIYGYPGAEEWIADGETLASPNIWSSRRHLPNVWLGVSVENQHWADIRIPALLETPAAIRFLSCEPLLGPVDLDGPLVPFRGRPKLTYWLTGRPGLGPGRTTNTGLVMHGFVVGPRIDWVIAGGESGPRARPMHPQWARTLRDQCANAGVPFFFKQHGAYRAWLTEADGYREPDLYINADGQALPEHQVPDTGRWQGVYRLGKKRAGRELDGRTWDDFPDSPSLQSW
jgi:protein gp37